jgi:hypothetical protein
MKNRAISLALAGLMLVVITGGTAFAATYNGVSTSYFNGPSDYSQTQNSYKNPVPIVQRGNTLTWNFNMNNHLGHTISYQIGAFGLDTNNWNYQGFSATTTALNDLTMYTSTGNTEYGGIVTDSSDNHVIMEGQTYWDGGYSYTLTFGYTGNPNSQKGFSF